MLKKWNKDNPEKMREYRRACYLRHKAKYDAASRARRTSETMLAHNRVALDIRHRGVVRPRTCSACAKRCKPDAHHPNHKQPDVYVWLCKSCHAKAHNA